MDSRKLNGIYEKLKPLATAEMVKYDDNKLYGILSEISEKEYKYLWALVFNGKIEEIKEKLNYLGISTL